MEPVKLVNSTLENKATVKFVNLMNVMIGRNF